MAKEDGGHEIDTLFVSCCCTSYAFASLLKAITVFCQILSVIVVISFSMSGRRHVFALCSMELGIRTKSLPLQRSVNYWKSRSVSCSFTHERYNLSWQLPGSSVYFLMTTKVWMVCWFWWKGTFVQIWEKLCSNSCLAEALWWTPHLPFPVQVQWGSFPFRYNRLENDHQMLRWYVLWYFGWSEAKEGLSAFETWSRSDQTHSPFGKFWPSTICNKKSQRKFLLWKRADVENTWQSSKPWSHYQRTTVLWSANTLV